MMTHVQLLRCHILADDFVLCRWQFNSYVTNTKLPCDRDHPPREHSLFKLPSNFHFNSFFPLSPILFIIISSDSVGLWWHCRGSQDRFDCCVADLVLRLTLVQPFLSAGGGARTAGGWLSFTAPKMMVTRWSHLQNTLVCLACDQHHAIANTCDYHLSITARK